MKITVTTETVFNDKKIIKTATAEIADEYGPVIDLEKREQNKIQQTTKTLLKALNKK
jgi:hypothetical protein